MVGQPTTNMAEVPFGASTWSVRGTVGSLLLNGVYSGPVDGPVHGTYDAISGVMQAYGRSAHHFNGFANMAAASLDHGSTWTTYFNAGHDADLNVQALAGWSLPHPLWPNTPNRRLHFQMRYAWKKATLVFDGTIQEAGGMDLFVSENGVAWNLLQSLHPHPAFNEIGGSGGAASFNFVPSITPPLLIEGSGPEGEDAYWMISNVSFDAGGAGNRTTFESSRLWRSVDGGLTWDNVREMIPVIGLRNLISLQRSTTGRLLLATSVGGVWTDDVDDLANATWTDSIYNGAVGGGNIVPMYGGTFLTHSQGTLTGPGVNGISCDDGANFFSGLVNVIPQNRGGFLAKIGASEALIVTSGFDNPTTETISLYSNDGGETWLLSEPWISSSVGEQPCMLELRTGARPIVLTRTTGTVYVTSDSPRGTFTTRTICPLANAGLAAARPLEICGSPIAINECSEG